MPRAAVDMLAPGGTVVEAYNVSASGAGMHGPGLMG
jgi:hypothetical protein